MSWAASANDNPFADPAVVSAKNSSAPGQRNDAPSWLQSSAQSKPHPPPLPATTGPPPTSAANPQPQSSQQNIPSLMIFMRLVNIGLCALLCATSIFSLIGLPSLATFVLSCYLFAFACILCCFETHIKAVASVAAENFGFLYNAYGRAVFLLFIGILCFSFKELLGYISGIAMIINAFYNFYVIIKYPEIEEQQQRRDLESQGKELLNNNRGAIVQHGIAYAKNNPQQAAQVARTANAYI